MEALPIFLDAIVPAIWAIIISVSAVLFFGEIIPQAVCTGPSQLRIASLVTPSVNFLMIAVGIVAYPISKILDCLLGEHHAIRYNNNDLKALIDLHSLKAMQEVVGDPSLVGFGLQPFQTKIIQGAIDIQNKKIQDIMIPFQRVMSLSIMKNLNTKTVKKILKWGFSRIPVYIEKDKNAIIGYLLIKSLIGVDLSQGKTLEELINDSIVTLRKPLYVSPNDPIGNLLARFKIGKSHMAIVTNNSQQMEENMKKYLEDDSFDSDENQPKAEIPKVLGIITLEDVIESTLREEILDEADYDIENNANLIFNNGFDNAKSADKNKSPFLHDMIQRKVLDRLNNKQSSPTFMTPVMNQDVEMTDLKEGLIDRNARKEDVSQRENLRAQLQNPELARSYNDMKRLVIN